MNNKTNKTKANPRLQGVTQGRESASADSFIPAKWRGEAVEHSETNTPFAPHSPASRCRWHRLLLQKQAGHRLDHPHYFPWIR